MAAQISAAFTLTGIGFDPDEVSRILGLIPTKVWRYGNQIQNTLLKREHDGWSLSTELSERGDLSKQVNIILEILYEKSHDIKKICEDFNINGEISCVIYAKLEELPEIHFSHEIIRKASELNAEIDVDLYVLP